MLQIVIPETECFNEETFEFFYTKEVTLKLEHSLISIYNWESKYHKPFLSKTLKTSEEMLDYIRFMTINKDVDKKVFDYLGQEQIDAIQEYIEDPMTATWFTDGKNKTNSMVITAEIIYYWMICNGIPFDCEKWHINRLLTLIQVCNRMNNPKKMSKKDIYSSNAKLNAERRKLHNTKG